MARIERPPIKANIGAKTARLDEPLSTVVAALAEALEGTKPEFVDVAVMGLHVIADFRRRDDTALCAILTQRMLEQLVPSDSSPASRGVPLVPLRRSAANAHGFSSIPQPPGRVSSLAKGAIFLPMPILDQSVELQEFCALNTRR
jgi:hypothetical protein